MNRAWLGTVGLLAVAILVVGVWFNQGTLPTRTEPPTWSAFKEDIREGQFAEVVFSEGEVQARRKDASGPNDVVRFTALQDPTLLALLDEHKVPYRAAPPGPCGELKVAWLFAIPMMALLLVCPKTT